MSSETGSGTRTGRSLSPGNGGRERTKTEGEEGERERQHVFPLTTTGGALPHPTSVRDDGYACAHTHAHWI